MVNISLQDVAKVCDPWTAIASGSLLAQSYQGLLKRLSFIALLFYWYVWISKSSSIYTQILSEIFRSKNASGGETDEWGKHWTLNIADTFVLSAFSSASSILFPDHYWAPAAVAVLLQLFVLGHHVVQLWMQTQIARLNRLNVNAWRWRAWVIDSSLLYMTKKTDSEFTRFVGWICSWVIHKASIFLLSNILSKWILGCWIARILYPTTATKAWAPFSKSIFFYRFWFHNFGKCLDPSPPEYKYTALQNPGDIRVLLLYPRFGFGKVCCSLLHGPHMQILIYEAISYNWGSGDATEEILIDGCTKKVTKSVYEILTSYSSLFLPKLLWIDMLCIDQENDVEKSKQVPLMEKIYQSAILTTVFLGRSPLPGDSGVSEGCLLPYRYDSLQTKDKGLQSYFEEAQLTIDLLNEFHILQGNALRGSEMSTYQLFEYLKLDRLKRRQWAATVKMLQHPWFERVWIIQEVALSGDVQVRYGDEVISWDLLVQGHQRLSRARHFQLWVELDHGVRFSHMQDSSLYNVARINLFRSLYRSTNDDNYTSRRFQPFGLADVLERSAFFRATNPRDLIFGVMSLCANPVVIDYTHTVEEIYLNTAKRLIDDGSIRFLLHAGGLGNRADGTQTGSNLPSWAPDWRETPNYERLRYGKSSQQSRLMAGGYRPPPKTETATDQAYALKPDGILALSGHFVDVIVELGPALFDTRKETYTGIIDEMHHLTVRYQECLDLLLQSEYTGPHYPYAEGSPSLTDPNSDQPLHEAFKRTLYLNTLDAKTLPQFTLWEAKMKLFANRSDAHARYDDKANELYEPLKNMDFVTETIKSCCGGRRLFVTSQGYIGLCPPYTKIDDLIYVVPGLNVPILLRRDLAVPSPGAPERVRFVGEAYVHGMTTGKGLLMEPDREEMEVV